MYYIHSNNSQHTGSYLQSYQPFVYYFVTDTDTIETVHEKMKLLYDRVLHAQKNVNTLITNIEVWSHEPLYERKDGKRESILGLDDRQERVNRRYELLAASAEEIKRVLDINYKLFFNIPLPEEPSEEEEEGEVCS